MKVKVKTIDVNCKEWFDKINGNSYFAGSVTINFSMKTEKNYTLPFQYGYGDHYRDEAFSLLQNNKVIPLQENLTSYWQYYRDNNIIVRHNMQRNCRKKELMYF